MDFFTRHGTAIDASAVTATKGESCTFTYMHSCKRCGGRGGCDAWAHTGWTCYECGGVGKWATSATGYSAEKLSKLNATRDKRRAKAAEVAQLKWEEQEQALAVLVDAFREANPGTVEWLELNARTDSMARTTSQPPCLVACASSDPCRRSSCPPSSPSS